MKRMLIIIAVVVMVMAIMAPALAGPPEHANNRTCTLSGGAHDDAGTYGVGETMQVLKARTYDADQHPAAVTVPQDTIIAYPSLGKNLGEAIALKCS